MFKRFISNKNGNFIVLGSLLAVPLALAVGFAVDTARLLNIKDIAQDAADAAVLAAVSQPSLSDSDIESLARSFFVSNEASKSQYDESNITVARDGDGGVSVAMSGQIDPTFMRIGNISPLSFQVSSSAAVANVASPTSDSGCVYLTDPRNTGLQMDDHSAFTANCVIMINSKNKAIDINDSAVADFHGICAPRGSLSAPNGQLTPSEKLDICNHVTDPFSDMDRPSILGDSCSTTTDYEVEANETLTLDPGVHCGEIEVEKDGVLELEAGTHYFEGGLDVDAGGKLEGDDVMMVLNKNVKNYTLSGVLDINGLTSGNYKGFVIYNEDFSGGSNTITVGSDANFRADGVIYLPNTNLKISTDVNTLATQSILVADRFELEGTASFHALINTQSATPLPDNENFATEQRVRLVQ